MEAAPNCICARHHGNQPDLARTSPDSSGECMQHQGNIEAIRSSGGHPSREKETPNANSARQPVANDSEEQCVLFGQDAEPIHNNDHRARRNNKNHYYDIVPVRVEIEIQTVDVQVSTGCGTQWQSLLSYRTVTGSCCSGVVAKDI